MIIINSLAPLPDQPLTPSDPEEIDSASENQTSAQVSEEREREGNQSSHFVPKPNQLHCCLLPIGYREYVFKTAS